MSTWFSPFYRGDMEVERSWPRPLREAAPQEGAARPEHCQNIPPIFPISPLWQLMKSAASFRGRRGQVQTVETMWEMADILLWVPKPTGRIYTHWEHWIYWVHIQEILQNLQRSHNLLYYICRGFRVVFEWVFFPHAPVSRAEGHLNLLLLTSGRVNVFPAAGDFESGNKRQLLVTATFC